MLKKLIGIVVAAATVALIVITALHQNNYRSMLPRPAQPSAAVPATETPTQSIPAVEAETPVLSADSTAVVGNAE